MDLFVDGIIFRLQHKGGISRIFQEILPAMCALDGQLRVKLLVQGSDRSALPKHEQIEYVPGCDWARACLNQPGLMRKAMVKLQQYLFLCNYRPTAGTVWYSSYYTLPFCWKGPKVVLVADLIHELYPQFFQGRANEAFRRRKRQVIMKADKIICISNTTRNDLIKFYKINPARAYVATLAQSHVFKVMPDEEKNARVLPKPYLLYIGTRVHYKNFDFFIKTYAAWPKAKAVALVLIGPPLNAQEHALVESLGLGQQVYCQQGVDDAKLCRFYNQALALVYPSIYEGFGIPLLEAMACGCPVIASDIASTREIAGDVPYYFKLGDVQGFLSALDEVSSAAPAKEQRRQQGFIKAGEYSWEKTGQETLKILAQAAADWNNP